MNEEGSIFNLENQNRAVTAKIVVSLERISEAFRTLLWRQSVEIGLSPIQIQILIFIQNHPENLSKVSYISNEFNLAKPTISEAVKTLIKKGLLIKLNVFDDNRSFGLGLTSEGEKLVEQLEMFATPLEDMVNNFSTNEQEDLFGHLAKLVQQIKSKGIIINQRTCFSCSYYANQDQQQYCNLLKAPLGKSEIRIDCPEFEIKDAV